MISICDRQGEDNNIDGKNDNESSPDWFWESLSAMSSRKSGIRHKYGRTILVACSNRSKSNGSHLANLWSILRPSEATCHGPSVWDTNGYTKNADMLTSSPAVKPQPGPSKPQPAAKKAPVQFLKEKIRSHMVPSSHLTGFGDLHAVPF